VEAASDWRMCELKAHNPRARACACILPKEKNGVLRIEQDNQNTARTSE
jgi:hypothetical protein